MTSRRFANGLARTALTAALWSAVVAGQQTAPPPQLPAQPPSTTQPPPPGRAGSGTGQVRGVIRSASDDKPIARARVSVVSDALPEPRVTISGADGRYAIGDLPAGAYIVSATRTGYAPQTYGQGRTITGTPVAVADAQQAAVDLTLTPGGFIVGRVLDEDGTPFAGAEVEALVSRFEAGADMLFSVSAAQTDDRGEFRLFGLAPGSYYVSAADPAFRRVSTPKGVFRYSPTYHPGTTQADQAKPVVVTGTGEPSRVEFRLSLIPPARVEGQLLTHDGRQLLSGAIIMSPLEGDGVPMVPPEEPAIFPDGRFSFAGVVPGRYQIRARGITDPFGAALFAVFSVDVRGIDVSGIKMTLRPGAILEGRLAVENTRGSKPPLPGTVRVRAPFIDGSSFGDALTGTVQPDGTFALRGIMRGSHQLVVDGLEPPWVLRSITHQGTDITDLQLDFAEREHRRDVRVTITDAASEVSGVVENPRKRPIAHAGVLIFSKTPLFWMRTNRRMRIAYTDQEGRFSVSGLPAGEYVAVTARSVDESDLGRRSRLEVLKDVGVSFRLPTDDARAALTLAVR
jgi:hypothetical protein